MLTSKPRKPRIYASNNLLWAMSGDKKRSSLRTSGDRVKAGDVYDGLRLRTSTVSCI
ncbi:hypothetical protein LC608_25290 [Nostoc sp. XA010]|uniref:hypothetical protein n=1 Tax=Nostoc sp. XA010 TaxID=2780407 RepID=UPI001E48AFCF|nr:hypothetical protein [Nostoc sp. XA010]MCC5660230.1 hypothetical protein [Nostoc sp. XA010]